MQYPKYLVLGLMALTLAGCGAQKAVETAQNQPKPQIAEQKSANLPTQNTTVVTPEPQIAQASTVTTSAGVTAPVQQPSTGTSTLKFEVDDTWQTYTNKALSFEFQWPTKGRYAPEWSVEFRKSDDPSIKDGCVTDSKTANSESKYQNFCHTISVTETDAVERTDYFTTKQGNQYVVITFFKKLYPSEKYKANNADDYEAMLESIMSTFKYTN